MVSARVEITITPQPSFAEMLERLWIAKHTGPVIVHFAGGRPGAVEIPAPSERIVLDKGRE